jgi:hypothetical protein
LNPVTEKREKKGKLKITLISGGGELTKGAAEFIFYLKSKINPL